MRQKSASINQPVLSEKKKPIKKDKNKPKILHYKPKKQDQGKQWQIQSIISQRIILKPKSIPQQSQNKHVKVQQQSSQISFNQISNYDKLNQFQIAWLQDRKEGLWPNTWEPEENIPDDIRLDYLLRKKNQFKQTKSKNQSHLKNKESLRQHINFTMNKQKFGIQSMTIEQKRKQSKKKLAKFQGEKLQPKTKKTQSYKDWFYSYSQKTELYEKLIYRFLNKQKNENKKNKQVPIIKSSKIQNVKTEFLLSVPLRKQDSDVEIQNVILKKQKQAGQSIESNYDKVEYVPKDSCLKLASEIDYVGQKNDINYFILKTQDDSHGFVTEEDLVKYFPWLYQKFMIRCFNQIYDECISLLEKIGIENFFDLKYLENLSYEIGFSRQYFRTRGSQYHNVESPSFKSASINNKPLNHYEIYPSPSIQFIGTNKSQVDGFTGNINNESSQEIQIIQHQKLFEVEQHFKSLQRRQMSGQILQISMNNCTQPFQFNQKLNDILNSISSKDLFKPNSNLVNNYRQTIKQNHKYRISSKQKNYKSIKIENSFDSKLTASSKKTLSTSKIQGDRMEQQRKKRKETTPKEQVLRFQDNKQSGKDLKCSRSQEIPYKKVKVTDEQDQIDEILGFLQERPKKGEQEFYDSEQESS